MHVQYASGHALDQSYLFLKIEDTTVGGRVEMTVADINTALGLSLPTDESVSTEILGPYTDRIQHYVAERVRLSLAGETTSLAFSDVGLLHTTFGTFVQLNFVHENLQQELREIEVEYSILFDIRPEHRGMLVIESNWKTGTFDNEANVSLIFEPGREQQTLDL